MYIAQLNPWVRGLTTAWDVVQYLKKGQTTVIPHEGYGHCCGSATGNEVIAYDIADCKGFPSRMCGLTGQAFNPNSDFANRRGLLYVNRYFIPANPPVDRVSIVGVFAGKAAGWKAPQNVPGVPIFGNVRINPKPLPEVMNHPVVIPDVEPHIVRIGEPDMYRRPPKGTKERKGRTQQMVAAAAKAAFAATEAVDLIDAIYKSLPEKIRNSVKATGKTTATARIGGGKPYVSPFDKAKALLKYYKQINLNDAMREVIYNYYEDKIIGGLSKGQQDHFRRMGFTRTGLT